MAPAVNNAKYGRGRSEKSWAMKTEGAELRKSGTNGRRQVDWSAHPLEDQLTHLGGLLLWNEMTRPRDDLEVYLAKAVL